MRQRDVRLSVVTGLALVPLAVLSGFTIGGLVISGATRFWYVGAAAVLVSLALRRSHTQPSLARLLGIAGTIWITFVVGATSLYFFLFALALAGR